ncbi:hypothetical protein H0H92_011621 [Tricholoma furcatifolium]|nr:hypothetical protein H0H92_011621 [Tricholoma furcatifolium]
MSQPIVSETTPLLQDDNALDDVGASRWLRTKIFDRSCIKTYSEELGILAWYSLPVFGSQLLETSILWASIFSIGHKSTTALSAVSLGALTAYVTAFTLFLGFAAALDTMLPAAWTSPQPQVVGLWCQRMLVLMCFLMIPILTLWFNMEDIFTYFKHEPEVAELASQYLHWLSWGLPGLRSSALNLEGSLIIFLLLQLTPSIPSAGVRYFQSQVWGPEEFQLGFIGAPIATAVSYNLISILSVIYGALFVPRTAWHPLSMRMFSNLRKLFVLGAGGAVSIVTAVRLGNLLGEANAARAKVAMNMSLLMTLMITTTINIAIHTFRQSWAHFFTDDPDVVKTVSVIVVWVGFYQFFDSLTAVLAGILRARGKQDSEGYGWGSLLAFGMVICLRTDWDREVWKATNRLKEPEATRSPTGENIVTTEV